MFELNQTVYWASCENHERWRTCPDCLGNKYLTVTMGDGTTVTIDCANCAAGYEPPCGMVKTYEYTPVVHEGTVVGIELCKRDGRERVEYGVKTYRNGRTGTYHPEEGNVFDKHSWAQVRARELIQERTNEEIKRFKQKEKPTRTWAWNATYHRRCIKEANRQLLYHTGKLEAAKRHAKEEKS